jgi:hypothetical protein
MDEDVFEGILDKIEKSTSSNPKAPAGYIYFVGLDKKLTVWSKSLFGSLIEKGKYQINYNHTKSEYGGRTYDNYTVVDMVDKNLEVDTDKLTFTKEYIEQVKESGFPTDKLKEGDGEVVWNIMNYPVKIDNSVKEIIIPKQVLDYLINLKGSVGVFDDKEVEEKEED